MPPRRETHFGVGVPVEDQNVDAGLVQPDGLPPHPPIPLAGGLRLAVVDTGRDLLSQEYQGGEARSFEMGILGQTADWVILDVVLVSSPMLDLVLGVTLEIFGGILELV
ncbi:hypothetical protein V6N13_059323 [Hibiscus sabdariffa]